MAKYEIEMAPDIIDLKESEMFRDASGKVFKIEMRTTSS